MYTKEKITAIIEPQNGNEPDLIHTDEKPEIISEQEMTMGIGEQGAEILKKGRQVAVGEFVYN